MAPDLTRVTITELESTHGPAHIRTLVNDMGTKRVIGTAMVVGIEAAMVATGRTTMAPETAMGGLMVEVERWGEREGQNVGEKTSNFINETTLFPNYKLFCTKYLRHLVYTFMYNSLKNRKKYLRHLVYTFMYKNRKANTPRVYIYTHTALTL